MLKEAFRRFMTTNTKFKLKVLISCFAFGLIFKANPALAATAATKVSFLGVISYSKFMNMVTAGEIIKVVLSPNGKAIFTKLGGDFG